MMRLLLISAAVASFVLLPGVAVAQMEVNLSGYVRFAGGAFENDEVNNSGRDFRSDSEIHITAKGQADNGLEYGARVELFSSTSDVLSADEAGLFLSGAWGRLELGDDDGASELGVVAPTVGLGQVNGMCMFFIPSADLGDTTGDPGSAPFKPIDSFDATKITYYTPSFSGFRAGISYAPEWVSNADGEVVTFSHLGLQAVDVFESALRYDGEFDGVGVALAAQYNFGNGGPSVAFPVHDLSAWGVGGQLAYGGFTVGGGYTHDGDSLNTTAVSNATTWSWNAGATYENGPWGFGLSYLFYDLDQNGSVSGALPSDGTGGTLGVVAGGAVYTVAPGLTVAVDAFQYDRHRFVGADTNGYGLIGGVTAAF